MRYPNLCGVLAVVLMAGASGCTALSGLGAGQETSAQQALPPELPAPALATLEKLIGGGEIWTLQQKEIGGRTVYDIRARVRGTDVRYEIARDGTVVATGEGVTRATLLEGVLAAGRKDFGSASALETSGGGEGKEALYEIEEATPRPL